MLLRSVSLGSLVSVEQYSTDSLVKAMNACSNDASVATTVIAPATMLSASLFYFGYVSSRAQHEYFGLDVDTIGLSTQDYVMRSRCSR